ncbi:enoyl-CoA hydratase/isomerase family protein [Rufibacter latericius]|uniref:Enoyl-CoA hydratase/isomerase family protein n=1 Tax=Rufibacter latericius TaxID=2487040 RepID=A0A3M9MV35_9BACT|nr:enoyl-CoA hydratase-related protein [Rufibacter latericius]RNI29359.1 enoyl-CoA hydratase/isomerase family protein [Rufibacter latericius]
MEQPQLPTPATLAFRYIHYHRSERVISITLNRPEKRNALNYEMVSELKQAFDAAENDDSCKVVILKASGPVFCAGADMEYLQQLKNNTYTENLEDSTHLMQLFYLIYTLKKVVIAQVNGHAIAGGCGLVTVCDFAYSVPSARLGFTEVKIGFLPAIVKVFLLRKIGEARTKELLLTGDLVPAEKAKSFGLLNEVVPEEELSQCVQELASRLCVQNSGQSMEVTKEMIARVQELPLREALEYAVERNALGRATDDCQLGIQAFLDKQPMTW